MCRRDQTWRSSSPYSYWLRISVGSALPARAMRRLLLRGGGGATQLSTEFRARNHAVLDNIDLVVGHGRSGVPLLSTRLHQQRLRSTLREDWSCKRKLETPCHTWSATSPQDIMDHVSGPAEPNVTWDTNFPR